MLLHVIALKIKSTQIEIKSIQHQKYLLPIFLCQRCWKCWLTVSALTLTPEVFYSVLLHLSCSLHLIQYIISDFVLRDFTGACRSTKNAHIAQIIQEAFLRSQTHKLQDGGQSLLLYSCMFVVCWTAFLRLWGPSREALWRLTF